VAQVLSQTPVPQKNKNKKQANKKAALGQVIAGKRLGKDLNIVV
jgi:hypothetical protein